MSPLDSIQIKYPNIQDYTQLTDFENLASGLAFLEHLFCKIDEHIADGATAEGLTGVFAMSKPDQEALALPLIDKPAPAVQIGRAHV